MQAIVLADGDIDDRAALDAAWPGWLAPDAWVVAADGGARHAAPLGLAIDQWVGDGDSLDAAARAELAASGVPMTLAPTDKDESDTELAVLAAIDRSATSIVLLGAHGGLRLDHALANVALLSMAELRDRADASPLGHVAHPARPRPGGRSRGASAISSRCCRSAGTRTA